MAYPEVKFTKAPRLVVAYSERNGPYSWIGESMRELKKWIDSKGVGQAGYPLCLFYDNPGETPAAQLRSEACIPALIRKFTEAVENGKREITPWGSGNASREFLYVENAAEGIVLAAERYEKPDPVNLGRGEEITIKRLAFLIGELAGFDGEVEWDTSKPDGQPQRLLDVNKAWREFGFKARTDLRNGLEHTLEWYAANRTRIL